MSSRVRLVWVAVGFATLALTGCAGTAPKAQFSHEILADSRVSATDQTSVVVDASDDVKILPMERERLAEKIEMKIESRKSANVGAESSRVFAVELHLTRYEKGNAFARAMLAGLGQIHIDGKVDVYSMPAHTLVGEFDLNKTFAWGGIYGASTSMEDIETTFSDGVAAAVTGQQEKPPKPKT